LKRAVPDQRRLQRFPAIALEDLAMLASGRACRTEVEVKVDRTVIHGRSIGYNVRVNEVVCESKPRSHNDGFSHAIALRQRCYRLCSSKVLLRAIEVSLRASPRILEPLHRLNIGVPFNSERTITCVRGSRKAQNLVGFRCSLVPASEKQEKFSTDGFTFTKPYPHNFR
jgi:hypothetical protein